MIPRSHPTASSGQHTGTTQERIQGSQLQDYDTASEAWSSSPPISQEALGDNNILYQENQSYEYTQQQQQQRMWQQQSSQLSPLQVPPRSSPIAIVRTSADGVYMKPEDTDDDDSDVDVERDARKLRRRYGDKVISSTFQGETTLSSQSVQQAPYLGSLSRSENYLMSLPPISLNEFHDDATPEVVDSYGSLRESHQRGLFLDGPSSYREPRSGQHKRLNYRLRYKNDPPALSIGERLQKSIKLKETRQKKPMESKKEEKVSGTSSLSLIMNEASKKSSDGGESPPPDSEPASTNGSMFEVPSLSRMEEDPHDQFDPPTMMSTSLTAFEVLRSSNQVARDANDMARSYVVQGNNSLLPPGDIYSSSMREISFQPLSRSMSDPTPQFLRAMNTNAAVAPPPPTQPTGWTTAYTMAPVNEMSTSKQTSDAINPPPVSYDQAGVINEYGYTAPEHNPDTDAAFDMDME